MFMCRRWQVALGARHKNEPPREPPSTYVKMALYVCMYFECYFRSSALVAPQQAVKESPR